MGIKPTKNLLNRTFDDTRHKKIDQHGFTLVELLMTIIVSVILIGSLSVVVSNNAFIAKKGRNLALANSYAENKIEEIRSKGFLNLENGTETITSDGLKCVKGNSVKSTLIVPSLLTLNPKIALKIPLDKFSTVCVAEEVPLTPLINWGISASVRFNFFFAAPIKDLMSIVFEV